MPFKIKRQLQVSNIPRKKKTLHIKRSRGNWGKAVAKERKESDIDGNWIEDENINA